MGDERILDSIETPCDVKSLDAASLAQLAAEIREELVSTVAETGGHLAPNLGVVELTLGIHRALDCPDDRIIFDVGHQSYVHKLITGRREMHSAPCASTAVSAGSRSEASRRSTASTQVTPPTRCPSHSAWRLRGTLAAEARRCWSSSATAR